MLKNHNKYLLSVGGRDMGTWDLGVSPITHILSQSWKFPHFYDKARNLDIQTCSHVHTKMWIS